MHRTSTELRFLLELPELGPPEEFRAGTELFRQGHQPSVLRLIVAGFVKTVREEHGGKALVSLRAPGWLLGMGAARLKLPHVTSGIAATSCRLRTLSVADFARHLDNSLGLSLWALDIALAEGRQDEFLRAEVLIYSATERLVRALIRLARLLDSPRLNGQVKLSLPITLGELAQMIGVTPEHLRHLVADLEARGTLIRRRGVLLLPLARWPQLAKDAASDPVDKTIFS